MAMLDKLNVIFQRFNEVNDLIIQPDVISDGKRYDRLAHVLSSSVMRVNYLKLAFLIRR